MNKKVVFSVIGGIVLVAILLIAQFRKDESTPTTVQSSASISAQQEELKSAPSLTYKIVLDRTSRMTREGRNFTAVIEPASPKPSVEQLSKLGERLRDEYKKEPFLAIELYDSEDAAKVDVFALREERDGDYEKLLDVQSHLLANYSRNDASGLNEFVIYPSGFTDTKYEDLITIKY